MQTLTHKREIPKFVDDCIQRWDAAAEIAEPGSDEFSSAGEEILVTISQAHLVAYVVAREWANEPRRRRAMQARREKRKG